VIFPNISLADGVPRKGPKRKNKKNKLELKLSKAKTSEAGGPSSGRVGGLKERDDAH